MKEKYPWVRKGIRVIAGITLLATGFMTGESFLGEDPGNGIGTVQAATAIEERNDCSLSVVIPEDSDYYRDTKQPEIKVNLYRVAKVTAECRFVVDGEVTDCGIDIQKLVEKETASEWADQAKQAAENLKNVNPVRSGSVLQGKCEFRGLQTGMYLIAPDNIESNNYEYTFAPYFVSLPGNLYDFAQGDADDTWMYQMESCLKVKTDSIDTIIPPRKTSGKTVISTVKTGDETKLMALIICAAVSLFIVTANVVELVRGRKKEESVN